MCFTNWLCTHVLSRSALSTTQSRRVEKSRDLGVHVSSYEHAEKRKLETCTERDFCLTTITNHVGRFSPEANMCSHE